MLLLLLLISLLVVVVDIMVVVVVVVVVLYSFSLISMRAQKRQRNRIHGGQGGAWQGERNAIRRVCVEICDNFTILIGLGLRGGKGD